MLLPVTSIFVWCARRPEMAENMERSMGRNSSGVGSPVGGDGGTGQDADAEPDDEVDSDEVEPDDEVDDEAEVAAISVTRPSAIAAPPTMAWASLESVASRTEVT